MLPTNAIQFVHEYSKREYQRLPSVHYANEIAFACSQLAGNNEFNVIGTNLILNTGQSLALTNDVWAYVNYIHHGFDKIDAKWQREFAKRTNCDFPNLIFVDTAQRYVTEILQKHFQHYHPYRVIRKSNELTLIYACITAEDIDDKKYFYKKTYQVLTEFMISFYDNLIEQCACSNPTIKYTRFYQDQNYRRRFIAGEVQDFSLNPNITEKELACLYWASRGKASNKIAIILNKSENTVRHQLSSVINKLGAQNITHAVYLALTNHILT